MGAADGKLVLGPDASLGYYYLSAQFDKEREYGVGFQVAEYRKPEYELSARTDKAEYNQGEQINVTAQASYFFGGPVKNGKVRWTLSTGDASFLYTGKGYWSFEDYDWYEPNAGGPFGGQISQGEGVTDADGRFTFSVPADISKYKRGQRFTFDITVQDVNNQAVSTQTAALVHKGAFYIGLKPRSYVAVAGQASQMDVITVDPQSQPVPGIPVTLVVNQVEWKSVRERAEDGNSYWVTRPKSTPVFTQTLTTDAAGTAMLGWTPKAPGEYKIDASARDAPRARHPQLSLHLGQRDRVCAVAHREQRPDRAGRRQVRVPGGRHRRDPGSQPLSRQGQGAADDRTRQHPQRQGDRAGRQQRTAQAAHRR